MALFARIKGSKRREVRLRVLSKDPNFRYKDVTYHIRPRCIYSYYLFFGLVRRDAIDYVEGNPEPIDYYAANVINTGKNLDVVSRIIGKILQYANKMITYILVISVGALIASVVGVLVSWFR